MRRFVLILSAAMAAVLAGVGSFAHAQMPMPKPAPELQKLDYFVGKWNVTGDMKPGPMGPGGKMTMTEEDSWMDGKFFLVAHSKFSGAGMGGGTGISFMGYDPDKKMYTYNEFNSMGEAEQSTGSFDGDTWTWSSDEKMGDKVMKGRFMMKVLTPTSYSFKFEVSPDGSSWSTVMDGTATKAS
jgi:Protein of unknown function (DUF1579)